MDAFEAAAGRLQRAETLCLLLRGPADAALLAEARALLKPLREQRAWLPLVALAEPLLRRQPEDHASRRACAQALIEIGATSAALALLQAGLQSLTAAGPAAAVAATEDGAESWGLIGRCHKQVFVETLAAAPPVALRALHEAAAAYALPYRADPRRHVWHGVNLLALGGRAALLSAAPAEGTATAAAAVLALAGGHAGLQALGQTLLQDLLARHAQDRQDPWVLASLAEVTLGCALLAGPAAATAIAGTDAALALHWLQAYLQHPEVRAFMVASTLRQFTEVWGLGAGGPWPGWALQMLALMRAGLLRLPGGALSMAPQQLVPAQARAPAPRAPAAAAVAAAPAAGALEALLGSASAKNLAWWQGGLQAARAVAVVRKHLGPRLGTGFLVQAGALGLQRQPDELLLLTNFHVVNREGLPPALAPAQAEVLFEAAEPGRVHTVAEVLWQSPVAEHDAALLRLAPPPQGIAPLQPALRLPPRPAPDTRDEDKPRVYVIGHPGGRELAIAMSDNALIDHEAPPEGQPAQPGVWRLHYRAPTEGGNSGSPVFNDEDWRVLALHHKGGRFGMPRLNGAAGTYAANEGLALPAIAAAVRQALEPD